MPTLLPPAPFACCQNSQPFHQATRRLSSALSVPRTRSVRRSSAPHIPCAARQDASWPPRRSDRPMNTSGVIESSTGSPRRTRCYIEPMITGPLIAEIAGLVGEPARATMLSALRDGRALTATELACAARVTPQTASTHLAKLAEAGVVPPIRDGRCRIFRLAAPAAGTRPRRDVAARA